MRRHGFCLMVQGFYVEYKYPKTEVPQRWQLEFFIITASVLTLLKSAWMSTGEKLAQERE